MNDQIAIDTTRRWISSMVIGLNLCPFAQRVFNAGLIRFFVSAAEDQRTLLQDLTQEFKTLEASPLSHIETTLLILPRMLADFTEFNAFLDVGERLIIELGLRGAIQIASFHPLYQFADKDIDAAENFTNRAPYPMLHLLREESFANIAGDSEELLAIPQRNIDTLRKMGREKILDRLKVVSNSTK